MNGYENDQTLQPGLDPLAEPVVPGDDNHGQPVDMTVLTQEIAGATMMGVRSIFDPHIGQGIDPPTMASVMLAAEQGMAMDYLSLAEEMEEKDLHYLGVLGTRKRAVAQLEITVEAADDSARCEADAELVRDWLNRDQLQMELFDILDAVGKGFSATEIIWDMSERQWMPGALKRRDPRWFQFDRIDGETLMLRDIGPPRLLPPYKFIHHNHPAKSGLPIRSGLARPVAWAWMFKNYSMKDWVAFAEIYGMPLRIGKHRVGETEENIRLLANAVANIGSDAAAVISESMTIDFLDSKGAAGANGEVFKTLAEYLDQQVSKVVLGQTATTDAIAGGHAVGKIHNEVRRDIMAADADMLQGTLNRDLVRPMVLLNNGPPVKGRFPKIRIGLPEAADVKVLSDALDVLVPMGLTVPVKWVRDKLGAPEPDDDEEVLRTPAAAAAPGGSADGSEGPDGAPLPPPEDATDRGEEQASLTDPAQAAATAFSAFSNLLKRQLKAAGSAATAAPGTPDAIDHGIDAALSDWKPIARALISPVEDLVASAASLEQVRDRLAGAIDQMSVEQVAELLAQSGFVSRLAGVTGQRIEPEQKP
jgi:phage gp29-like protein